MLVMPRDRRGIQIRRLVILITTDSKHWIDALADDDRP